MVTHRGGAGRTNLVQPSVTAKRPDQDWLQTLQMERRHRCNIGGYRCAVRRGHQYPNLFMRHPRFDASAAAGACDCELFLRLASKVRADERQFDRRRSQPAGAVTQRKAVLPAPAARARSSPCRDSLNGPSNSSSNLVSLAELTGSSQAWRFRRSLQRITASTVTASITARPVTMRTVRAGPDRSSAVDHGFQLR